MKNNQFSKEQILSIVNHESSLNRDVCFELENIRLAFGFNRMGGEEIMLRKLVFPSQSEEQMQSLSPNQLMLNFEKWCREVGISYGFDFVTHRYFLRKRKINAESN